MDQACDTTLLPNDEEIERKTMVAAYAAQIALLDGCGEAVSGGYAGTKSGQQQVLPGQLGAIAATFSKLRASGVQAVAARPPLPLRPLPAAPATQTTDESAPVGCPDGPKVND